MTIYQIIYGWFESLIDGSNLDIFTFEIGGQTLAMDSWLCHSATIIVLVACCLFLFACVKYLFKAGAGLFKW